MITNISTLSLLTLLEKRSYVTENDIKDLAFPQFCNEIIAQDEEGKISYQNRADSLTLPDFHEMKSDLEDSEPLFLSTQYKTKNATIYNFRLAFAVTRKHKLEYARAVAGKASDLPAINPVEMARRKLSHDLLSAIELHALTTATTTGNYASGHTTALSAGERWDEDAVDPGDELIVANRLVELHSQECNMLVSPPKVLSQLYKNPFIRDKIVGLNGGFVSDDAFAGAFLNGGKVVRVKSIYNNAAVGAAENVARMMDDDAIFAYKGPDGKAPGHAPKSFMSYLTIPGLTLKFWKKPYQWSPQGPDDGHYEILDHAFGLTFVPESSTSDKIANGVLYTTVIS